MSEQCPNCLSRRIGKNNYGKKTAGVVGGSAGTYGGYAAATAGAQAGAALGTVAGPVGANVGGISKLHVRFATIQGLGDNLRGVTESSRFL